MFFSIPSGKCGKELISEIAWLLQAYAEATALESIALKAVTVLCILLLQKPYSASKSRDHVACLERRLVLWHAGDIPNLFMEGRTIQQRLCGHLPRPCDDLRLARIFANLMFQGKTKASIHLLTTQSKGGCAPPE